jgi:hypothetical protein
MTTALLSLLLLAPAAHADIIKVDTSESFAGKFGKRVQQRLTLQANGKTWTVTVRQHTRFGPVRRYEVGDKLRF